MENLIRETAMKWADAIQSRDAGKVIQLYHPDALLWGTLSVIIRKDHMKIHDYFMEFLDQDGLECIFTEGYSRIYDDFAFYSGTYEFHWKADGLAFKVPARFSFVYKKEKGKWLIMEHHSSLFPDLPLDVRKYVI